MADYATHGRRSLVTIDKHHTAKWPSATDQDQTFDRKDRNWQSQVQVQGLCRQDQYLDR